MIYRVEHRTQYRYSMPVSLSYNDSCLALRSTPCQAVLSSRWDIQPRPDFLRERTDFFGNLWRMFSFERGMNSMDLTTTHQVNVTDRFTGSDLFASSTAFGSTRAAALPETAPFLWASPFVPTGNEYRQYGAESFTAGRSILDCALDLTTRIFNDFEYSPQSTTISTPVSEVARTRKGVCQDYAHFALAVLRSLSIPARYVSGYLHTRPAANGTKTRGADASHAWISVFDATIGWVDFDPTNGILVRDGHITIAWGRDYGDVSPLKGVVLGGGSQTLKVEVQVDQVEGAG